jgi:hypothetical protein
MITKEDRLPNNPQSSSKSRIADFQLELRELVLFKSCLKCNNEKSVTFFLHFIP